MGRMKKLFKGKISSDRLLSIMAFGISLCTLYVFFYQTSLMKKQQYASVLPYLEIGNTEIDGDYGFILQNNGIGPAFIDEINIHYKDSVYNNTDVINFYRDIVVKQDTMLNLYNVSHATIRKGMLVPEKEVKYMLRLNNGVKNYEKKQSQLRQWLNGKIQVEIKYSSVYGEKWKIRYPETESPIKVK